MIFSSKAEWNQLVSLSFSNCMTLEAKHLEHIGEVCPFVQQLDLSGCKNLSNDALDAVSLHSVI